MKAERSKSYYGSDKALTLTITGPQVSVEGCLNLDDKLEKTCYAAVNHWYKGNMPWVDVCSDDDLKQYCCQCGGGTTLEGDEVQEGSLFQIMK